MEYYKHLSEPWFTYVCFGVKTVEGRPSDGSFGQMNEGDIIILYNDDMGTRRECKVLITKISYHRSFENMLKHHTLKRTLPGYRSIEKGAEEVYKKYYPKFFDKTIKEEDKPDVLGISMKVIN